MLISDEIISAEIVQRLRIKAFLKGVSQTDISKSVNEHRETVSKRLKGSDMKLSEFIRYSRAIDENPSTLFNEGFNSLNSNDDKQKGMSR